MLRSCEELGLPVEVYEADTPFCSRTIMIAFEANYTTFRYDQMSCDEVTSKAGFLQVFQERTLTGDYMVVVEGTSKV